MQDKPKTLAPDAKAGADAPRAWQRMLSGRRLDLLDPSPFDIEIEDIAHGLARVARWNGQTQGEHAFSVAQHCVLVERIACDLSPRLGARLRLAALLHDAPEYVIGDLISPFKAAVGLNYKAFEQNLLRAIHIRFGLAPDLDSCTLNVIKKADRIAAFYEATRLARFTLDEATRFFGAPQRLGPDLRDLCEALEPVPAREAQTAYLACFEALSALAEQGAITDAMG
mgnify:CR=1 FL=1